MMVLIVLSHGAAESEGMVMRRISIWPEAGWAPNRGGIHHALNSLAKQVLIAKLDRERIDFDHQLGSGPRKVAWYVITGHGRAALASWLERMEALISSPLARSVRGGVAGEA